MRVGGIYRSEFYKNALLVFVVECKGTRPDFPSVDGFFFDLTAMCITRDQMRPDLFTGCVMEVQGFKVVEALIAVEEAGDAQKIEHIPKGYGTIKRPAKKTKYPDQVVRTADGTEVTL